MSETRKLAAILVSDVVGYSRLAGADEDRILARLRALRSDLIDPTIAVHHGRVVKRTGDGAIVEFRSVVDAVNCAIEVQRAMVERNAGVAPDKRIEFRIGIHLGDVVEESDGDLMGDGVNIAARLEGIAKPGRDLSLRGRLSAGQGAARSRGQRSRPDPTQEHRRADPGLFARSRHARCRRSPRQPQRPKNPPRRASRSSSCRSPISAATRSRSISSTASPRASRPTSRAYAERVRDRAQHRLHLQGQAVDLKQIGRELNVRYVLEGSVQRGGNRMRVNVQLIDAETGNHLWAERFDKPLADLFDMQDEIVARLAGALNAQLVAAEARRAEQAPNPDSMDLYFQGLAWLNKGLTPDNVAQARSFFDRALAADPDNVDALVGSARADVVEGALSFVTDPIAAFAAAEAKLTKALSSVPDHALGHMCVGTCRHIHQARCRGHRRM